MEELKATLRCKIRDIYIKGEDGEATKTFEKKLQGFQVHRNQEESDLHGQIVKLDMKLIEKESDVEIWKLSFMYVLRTLRYNCS